MNHHIVIEKVEGRTDAYEGYKYVVCEVLVEDVEDGWPKAIDQAKKIVEVERFKDGWNTKGSSPNTYGAIGGPRSETVYECYSRKTEPLILE
jgi:hypothetical protein